VVQISSFCRATVLPDRSYSHADERAASKCRPREDGGVLSLSAALSRNAYPGRGVLVSRTCDGKVSAAYFLTGRSDASRDRFFSAVAGELRVGPRSVADHDPLRHYVAATVTDDWLVVGNGTQVSEVARRVSLGDPPVVALSDLEYEPDPPIRTSRITAVVSRHGRCRVYLGSARPSLAQRSSANVMTLCVSDLEAGEGVLLTTYRSDGVTIAPGVPYEEIGVECQDEAGLLDEVWHALDARFRVATAVIVPQVGPSSAVLRMH
jgi:IMP cyclohydrolase